MKRLACALALVLAGSCHAAYWKTIYQDGEFALFDETAKALLIEVDLSSITIRDGLMQAWIRHSISPAVDVPNLYPSKKYRSTLTLGLIDCAQKEVTAIRIMYYAENNASGAFLGSSNYGKEKIRERMQPIAPGTVGEVSFGAICALRPKK